MEASTNIQAITSILKDLEGFWFEPRIDSGELNMETDKRLMETVQTHAHPLVLLRAYAWAQPTLSLGIHQPIKDLDNLSPPESMPIVRRPTGGRAIWHGEDYSYAFVSNAPALLHLSVKDSYCVISQILKRTLQNLGIESESAASCISKKDTNKPSGTYTRSPECFATQMPDDLVVKAGNSSVQKIAGSAQCRKSRVLLQHGSVFLNKEGVFFDAFATALKGAFETFLKDPVKAWS
jgi:lipoate---protein ligase